MDFPKTSIFDIVYDYFDICASKMTLESRAGFFDTNLTRPMHLQQAESNKNKQLMRNSHAGTRWSWPGTRRSRPRTRWSPPGTQRSWVTKWCRRVRLGPPLPHAPGAKSKLEWIQD